MSLIGIVMWLFVFHNVVARIYSYPIPELDNKRNSQYARICQANAVDFWPEEYDDPLAAEQIPDSPRVALYFLDLSTGLLYPKGK